MCSQTAAHSAIAAMTGSRKSFGCGLVKRIRSIPSTCVERAQELPELGSHLGREIPAPGVDVLAEQRDLANPLRPSAATSATTSPGRRLCSRPRTDGTMQYAHLELQPMEICTQAWKGRSRWTGSSAGEMPFHSAKRPRAMPCPPAPTQSAK